MFCRSLHTAAGAGSAHSADQVGQTELRADVRIRLHRRSILVTHSPVPASPAFQLAEVLAVGDIVRIHLNRCLRQLTRQHIVAGACICHRAVIVPACITLLDVSEDVQRFREMAAVNIVRCGLKMDIGLAAALLPVLSGEGAVTTFYRSGTFEQKN